MLLVHEGLSGAHQVGGQFKKAAPTKWWISLARYERTFAYRPKVLAGRCLLSTLALSAADHCARGKHWPEPSPVL